MEFYVFTGYFKKLSESMSNTGQRFIKLEIPNKEVKYIFITKIKSWLDERIENENFDDMYNAMFEGDEKVLKMRLQICF